MSCLQLENSMNKTSIFFGQKLIGGSFTCPMPTRVSFSRDGHASEGREKYVRELSVTPVGYFTGAIENSSRGVSPWDFCMAKMRYFGATGMIFPRLALL
jgi:hypothetical protein